MPATFGTPKPARSTAAPLGCLIFFMLVWSGATLGLDGVFGRGALRQIRASGFPKVAGRVTKSGIKATRGSKGGTTFSPQIEYTYQVAGKNYRGDRYRYGLLSANHGSAQQVVAAFPVGRTIDVFYSPDDPSEAVLKTGLEGSDLIVSLFLLPFNLYMVASWYCTGQSIHRRFSPVPAGGAKITDDGFTTRVRLSNVSPLGIGLVTISVLAFFAILAVVIAKGTDPPLEFMFAAWTVVVGAGLIAMAITWMKLAQGDGDLLIDESSHLVTLPATFGRTESLAVPLRQVRAIDVEQITSKGEGNRTIFRYAPILVFSGHDESQRREKLAEWSSQADATALAAWLRERLKLAPIADDAPAQPHGLAMP